MWLDGIPRGMEAFSAECEEKNNDIVEKLNPDNYKFIFDGKIKLDSEEVLPKENLEKAKMNIQEQYYEFQKALEKVKQELEELK